QKCNQPSRLRPAVTRCGRGTVLTSFRCCCARHNRSPQECPGPFPCAPPPPLQPRILILTVSKSLDAGEWHSLTHGVRFRTALFASGHSLSGATSDNSNLFSKL